MARLDLYTRHDCPLCDEAAALLRRLAPELGLTVEEVDIEGQPALLEWYQYLVPVVALDGQALLYPPITELRLRAALAQRQKGGSLSRGGV